MFMTGGAAPEAEVAAPAAGLPSAPAGAPAGAPAADAEPGEFTRMFLAAGIQARQPAAGPPATAEAPPAVGTEPGAFTRLFQTPAPAAAPGELRGVCQSQ